ncbi:hypothetical protein JBL43_00185 [Aureibaculum sp. A20]|uniref:Carboxypeptidase-like regulatory domain-containing protein n=1 Tax=Aureibaculum flavum TaxID=2795986 RepID=A0ABS0WKZ1_9FLAO|nr:hypothetical protein [Aureibaculum flavum]MBJ2172635.1 hypothetical protein [Aureibaculum flavum]
MKKSTYLILFLLYSISVSAQEDRTLLYGTIKSDEKDLTNLHVINKTSQKGTITNSEGQFSIFAKPSDTLFFRGIQFISKEVVITETNIDNKSILVELTIKTNELKEVYLRKRENMAKALNLPNADKEPLTGIDRKLAYYSQDKTHVVILKTLLGQAGGIDNIYNIISGNRKKHRKLKKLIEDDKLLERNKLLYKKIRTHFKDDFFIYSLKIPSNKIDDFIKFCVPKNIINLFHKKSYLQVIDIFFKQSKLYLKKLQHEE